jgi:hypothetical protein
MRRRIKREFVLPLVGLLLGVGVFPDVVFCSGENGHRAFELTTRDCCHAGSADDDCQQNHCASNCKDIRFSADAMLSGAGCHESARQASVHAPMLGVGFALTSALPVVSFRATRVAPHVPAPRQRHTTVQLC